MRRVSAASKSIAKCGRHWQRYGAPLCLWYTLGIHPNGNKRNLNYANVMRFSAACNRRCCFLPFGQTTRFISNMAAMRWFCIRPCGTHVYGWISLDVSILTSHAHFNQHIGCIWCWNVATYVTRTQTQKIWNDFLQLFDAWHWIKQPFNKLNMAAFQLWNRFFFCYSPLRFSFQLVVVCSLFCGRGPFARPGTVHLLSVESKMAVIN